MGRVKSLYHAMPLYATLRCHAMRCDAMLDGERVVGADIEELVYVYMAFFNFTTFHSPGAHLEADCVWNKIGLNSST